MIQSRCNHCGSVNQSEIQYDNGWESHCIMCGGTQPYGNKLPDNMVNHGRYDVQVPYTQSPSIGKCTKFDTIPMFARQSFFAQEMRASGSVKSGF
jgi:hypothetical protein